MQLTARATRRARAPPHPAGRSSASRCCCSAPPPTPWAAPARQVRATRSRSPGCPAAARPAREATTIIDQPQPPTAQARRSSPPDNPCYVSACACAHVSASALWPHLVQDQHIGHQPPAAPHQRAEAQAQRQRHAPTLTARQLARVAWPQLAAGGAAHSDELREGRERRLGKASRARCHSCFRGAGLLPWRACGNHDWHAPPSMSCALWWADHVSPAQA
jgi:hypothetical protein